MKKLTVIVLALFLTVSFISPSLVHAETKSDKIEWKYEDGMYYALNNSNEKIKGWVKDESNNWHFIDYKTGIMKKGWLADGANWYYFNPRTGAMKTGWVTLEGKKYYFEPSENKQGIMAVGNKTIDGINYEFDEMGRLHLENYENFNYTGFKNFDIALGKVFQDILKPSMSDYEVFLAIHNWIANHYVYDLDNSLRKDDVDLVNYYESEFNLTNEFEGINEYKSRDFIKLFSKKRGLCADYARLFTLMTTILGYEVYSVNGIFTNNDGTTYSHVWNQVNSNGKQYLVDVMLDDNYDRGLHYNYFMKEAVPNGYSKGQTSNFRIYDDAQAASYGTVFELFNLEELEEELIKAFDKMTGNDEFVFGRYSFEFYTEIKFDGIKESEWEKKLSSLIGRTVFITSNAVSDYAISPMDKFEMRLVSISLFDKEKADAYYGS